MSAEPVSDLKFEIGHGLFVDIVGYSKLLISEQSERTRQLKEIVRGRSLILIASLCWPTTPLLFAFGTMWNRTMAID